MRQDATVDGVLALRADNEWLRNEMATNMIYKKEADELRAEIERLRAALVEIRSLNDGMDPDVEDVARRALAGEQEKDDVAD